MKNPSPQERTDIKYHSYSCLGMSSTWAILLSHLLDHIGLVAGLSATYTSLNIEACDELVKRLKKEPIVRFDSVEAWMPASWQCLLLGDMPRSGVPNLEPVRSSNTSTRLVSLYSRNRRRDSMPARSWHR
jgi:hypothetical protein